MPRVAKRISTGNSKRNISAGATTIEAGGKVSITAKQIIIDVGTLLVTTEVDGLGTSLFDVSIHPNGKIYVPNTDALNFVRFEHPLGVQRDDFRADGAVHGLANVEKEFRRLAVCYLGHE